jgi:hypothetical protein
MFPSFAIPSLDIPSCSFSFQATSQPNNNHSRYGRISFRRGIRVDSVGGDGIEVGRIVQREYQVSRFKSLEMAQARGDEHINKDDGSECVNKAGRGVLTCYIQPWSATYGESSVLS